MTLTSEAQLIVEDFASAEDDASAPPHIHLGDEVVVYDAKPTSDEVLEVHEIGPEMHLGFEDGPLLDRIPGAPPEAQDDLMVEDTAIEIEPEEEPKSKKVGIWDWTDSHGFEGFVEWVKDRLQNIPTHSGTDVAGCERAIAYMERVRDEIRSAMKKDLEGVLNAQAIEHLYTEIDDGIARLEERAESLGDKFKSKKKKKKAASADSSLVKEGQKATHVGGIIVTVPLLIHRLARVCINGTVSAGHDIEDLFGKAVKKYALDNREQAELMQLLSDMGYPLRRDRGYDINEEVDPTEGGADFAANYQS